jgi:hypothetical protein
MTVAAVDAVADEVAWLGVGNVEGRLLRVRGDGGGAAPLRGGVVGYMLPRVRTTCTPICRGDLLVLASDGIRAGFEGAAARRGSPQGLADRILAEHGSESDDAIVLVARYLGAAGSPEAPGRGVLRG